MFAERRRTIQGRYFCGGFWKDVKRSGMKEGLVGRVTRVGEWWTLGRERSPRDWGRSQAISI